MIIRAMMNQDYESVYRLWTNTPDMGLNTTDDSREGIERYLKRNPSTCFVAEENGEIVGAILAGHDGRRGFLYHTAVSVPQRKRGIGRALVDRAIKALKQEGISKAALVVFSKNDTGNEFWEKQGFSVREDLLYRNRSIKELERIDT